MESFLKCEKCNNYFNKQNHKPIIFLECLDTVCLECVKSVVLQNKVSENQFKCCINQDHIINFDPNNIENLKVNPNIMRNLDSQNYLPIFCSLHKNQIAQFLIQSENRLACDVCLIKIQSENEEKLEIREISKVGIKRYADQSIELLEKGVQNLKSQLNKLQKISEESLNLDEIEVINMLSTNQKLFQSTLPNQEEYQTYQSKIINDNFKIQKHLNQPQESVDANEMQQNSFKSLNQDQSQNLDKKQKQMFDNFHSKVEIEVNKKMDSVLKGFLQNWQTAHFQLLYKASRDGFDPKIFHNKCDCKGSTLTFLLSEHGKVFGFYTSISLINYQHERDDKEIFLFQLDYKTIHKPIYKDQMKINNKISSFYIENRQKLINLDFYLNEIIFSSEYFGNIFEIPHLEENKEVESYLGGSKEFKVLEMEVYQFI